MAEDKHPGISMHKIPVGGGFAGLLFAAGSVIIFLLGLPALWYFVAFAAVLGIGVAVFLRATSRHSSERNKPMSILNSEEKPAEVVSMRERRSKRLQASPALS